MGRVDMRRTGLRTGQWGRAQLGMRSLVATLTFLAALALPLVLSGCGYVSGGDSFSAAQRQQLTSLAQRAAAPDSSQVQTSFDGADVSVTVTVGWTPQIGIGDIAKEQERVKAICFREQQALWASGVPLHQATVLVLGPVQDDYADMILDAHALAQLSATTAATFSWASLTPDSSWGKYDSVWLRATYQPHVVGS